VNEITLERSAKKHKRRAIAHVSEHFDDGEKKLSGGRFLEEFGSYDG
jgi:hypothetical protein